jgi:hypothetical protein
MALGTDAPALKDDPLPHLAPWLTRSGTRRCGTPPKMPSLGMVGGWASALLSSGDPLHYLRDRRGLSEDTLRRYEVGWDAKRGDLTFPAWDGREVVYVYRRKPVDGARMIACGGPRRPYPDLPKTGALVLVAGEIDALTGRELGINAVTVSGCELPEHARPRFAGRTVYVMFDVGEEEAARRVAAKLGGIASRTSVVRLSTLRLPLKSDLNDLYRQRGAQTQRVVNALLSRSLRSQGRGAR